MFKEQVFKLAVNCAARQLSPIEFISLYKEFYNEKVLSTIDELDADSSTVDSVVVDAKTSSLDENNNNNSNNSTGTSDQRTHDANTTTDNITHPAGNNNTNKKKIVKDDSINVESYNQLALEFINILNKGNNSLLLSEYLVQILFGNYDSSLLKVFLTRLNNVQNIKLLVHFFSKSCTLLLKLNDKLIIDQIIMDLNSIIIPNIVMDSFINTILNNNELLVIIIKFLQIVLNASNHPIRIANVTTRDNLSQLLNKLFKINKLFHRKVSNLFEKKLVFVDPDSTDNNYQDNHTYNIHNNNNNSNNNITNNKDLTNHETLILNQPPLRDSPSITSPNFISSPLSMLKTPLTNMTNINMSSATFNTNNNISNNNKINNNTNNTTTHNQNLNSMRYKDMKLLRYYKNIWFNSKIMNWDTNKSDFLLKYNSISSYIFQNNSNNNSFASNSTTSTTNNSTNHNYNTTIQNPDSVIIDLIDTSFTCFAQYISNKQYHRTNCNLNLLERQWIIFITKHLPLIILNHKNNINLQIIKKALEDIDPKVIKVIKSYYSEKDDMRNRNEDLFDDFSSTSFDIRHDFIQSLVILGLQSPNIINDFLREDQLIDPKSLPINDDLIITTSQGIKEVVNDIPLRLAASLDSLELERIGDIMTNDSNNNNINNLNSIDSNNMNNNSNVNNNGNGNVNGINNGNNNINNDTTFNDLYQILNNFENIAPTKQNDITLATVELLNDAINNNNNNRITKICALLIFNFSHSLTTFFTFYSPKSFVEILMKFIDQQWSNSIDLKIEETNDSLEKSELSLSFSWALLLLISIIQNYNISLIDVAITSKTLNIQDSFSIHFTSKLSEVTDEFSIDEKNLMDPEVRTQSHKLVQNWLTDLFINGSLSDQLTQHINAKQIAILLPFILKQVLYAIELNSMTDINNAIGGFEYFLQPFMIIGLIKIMFWLEDYLTYLYDNDKDNGELIQKIFMILNSLINPTALNEDSKIFHNAVLRINAVHLLKVLRKYQSQETQSSYGVYSSDAQETSILSSIINKLVNVLNFAPLYNMDPRVISTDNIYSQQKPIAYNKLIILNENPINKILANQINSFWNLHSSTYYNLDYLDEIIKLLTPKNFISDVLQTLNYKLMTYGVPTARNKMGTMEAEHVLDYFFYFLVLHDCQSQWDAINMINLLNGDMDQKNINTITSNNNNGSNNTNNIKTEETIMKEEPAMKQESLVDDDFDMLFGENETSVHGIEDDISDVNVPTEDDSKILHDFYVLKRNSFGVILYELKTINETAYKSGDLPKKEYDIFKKNFEKYLKMLKTCVF